MEYRNAESCLIRVPIPLCLDCPPSVALARRCRITTASAACAQPEALDSVGPHVARRHARRRRHASASFDCSIRFLWSLRGAPLFSRLMVSRCAVDASAQPKRRRSLNQASAQSETPYSTASSQANTFLDRQCIGCHAHVPAITRRRPRAGPPAAAHSQSATGSRHPALCAMFTESRNLNSEKPFHSVRSRHWLLQALRYQHNARVPTPHCTHGPTKKCTPHSMRDLVTAISDILHPNSRWAAGGGLHSHTCVLRWGWGHSVTSSSLSV